jgi:hypothetical protein
MNCELQSEYISIMFNFLYSGHQYIQRFCDYKFCFQYICDVIELNLINFYVKFSLKLHQYDFIIEILWIITEKVSMHGHEKSKR